MSEELDRHQQDRTYLSRYGAREVQGKVDSDAYTGDGTFLAFTSINIQERSSTPPNPPEGWMVLWLSDGTGAGDDGDTMITTTAGGATKTIAIRDFSAG